MKNTRLGRQALPPEELEKYRMWGSMRSNPNGVKKTPGEPKAPRQPSSGPKGARPGRTETPPPRPSGPDPLSDFI